MGVWRIEVQLAATMYVKADTAEEAMKTANDLKDGSIDPDGGDIPICGLMYDDPDLPQASLSPAMTCKGPWPDENAETIECVED